ncbi:ras-associated and pleckstrin homology domains-containing protein 1b isoform X2 [Syngnathoides biaculeatus]|nr:ras-associated and pleckstrin homology domains-containing protein 1b isoform X2 [Syngnathoides biaculeatus]XP_061659854.1 ras-associated and pleckstrin homology domains-containing protein 1b isoform X2 [Syngnathoides biaculeatus]XP_061659862.1 ras-associated and pleckstrin homology domains-containing protein 1b isoform X2 [Syngnathoides biaculeatus]XP_061659872.1 ras-associated and pleckstrin homology domains-containing protein 1b isoform X2 [Syngnathoides biaculeatus]XP_061659882.1 ras-asso
MEQVSDDELDHGAEEDSDKEDQDLDKMFGAWLGELDKITQGMDDGRTQKALQKPPLRQETNIANFSYRFSMYNINEALNQGETVDLDALMADLCTIEQELSTISKPNSRSQSKRTLGGRSARTKHPGTSGGGSSGGSASSSTRASPANTVRGSSVNTHRVASNISLDDITSQLEKASLSMDEAARQTSSSSSSSSSSFSSTTLRRPSSGASGSGRHHRRTGSVGAVSEQEATSQRSSVNSACASASSMDSLDIDKGMTGGEVDGSSSSITQRQNQTSAEHVKLRWANGKTARRHLDFTPQEGEVDRATHSYLDQETSLILKSIAGKPSHLLTKEEHAAKQKAEKIRVALEKIKEAQVKKLVIRVHMSDESSKTMMVDERQTVRQVLDSLLDKSHCGYSSDWSLVETITELQMERIFEDHENLVENLLNWTRDSHNKLMFSERIEKYALFKNPQNYLLGRKETSEMADRNKEALLEECFCGGSVSVPEIEGVLWLKEDGKKSWKKRYFLLRASGIYYVPKGKGKASRDLVCFLQLDHVNVYYGQDYRCKYKAPTDYCLALKHPQIQKKSQYIKYLCCDDVRTLHQWVNGIRIAKYGKQLYVNYQEAMRRTEAAYDWSSLSTSSIRSGSSSASIHESQSNHSGHSDSGVDTGSSHGRSQSVVSSIFSEAWKRGTQLEENTKMRLEASRGATLPHASHSHRHQSQHSVDHAVLTTPPQAHPHQEPDPHAVEQHLPLKPQSPQQVRQPHPQSPQSLQKPPQQLQHQEPHTTSSYTHMPPQQPPNSVNNYSQMPPQQLTHSVNNYSQMPSPPSLQDQQTHSNYNHSSDKVSNYVVLSEQPTHSDSNYSHVLSSQKHPPPPPPAPPPPPVQTMSHYSPALNMYKFSTITRLQNQNQGCSHHKMHPQPSPPSHTLPSAKVQIKQNVNHIAARTNVPPPPPPPPPPSMPTPGSAMAALKFGPPSPNALTAFIPLPLVPQINGVVFPPPPPSPPSAPGAISHSLYPIGLKHALKERFPSPPRDLLSANGEIEDSPPPAPTPPPLPPPPPPAPPKSFTPRLVPHTAPKPVSPVSPFPPAPPPATMGGLPPPAPPPPPAPLKKQFILQIGCTSSQPPPTLPKQHSLSKHPPVSTVMAPVSSLVKQLASQFPGAPTQASNHTEDPKVPLSPPAVKSKPKWHPLACQQLQSSEFPPPPDSVQVNNIGFPAPPPPPPLGPLGPASCPTILPPPHPPGSMGSPGRMSHSGISCVGGKKPPLTSQRDSSINSNPSASYEESRRNLFSKFAPQSSIPSSSQSPTSVSTGSPSKDPSGGPRAPPKPGKLNLANLPLGLQAKVSQAKQSGRDFPSPPAECAYFPPPPPPSELFPPPPPPGSDCHSSGPPRVAVVNPQPQGPPPPPPPPPPPVSVITNSTWGKSSLKKTPPPTLVRRSNTTPEPPSLSPPPQIPPPTSPKGSSSQPNFLADLNRTLKRKSVGKQGKMDPAGIMDDMALPPPPPELLLEQGKESNGGNDGFMSGNISGYATLRRGPPPAPPKRGDTTKLTGEC